MEEPGAQVDDEALMKALAQGKDSALNGLMEKYRQALYSFLFRFVQNETDAADLAQESFVRIYQNRQRFNPNQKFTTWMFQIATNLAKDRLRWRARHPEASTDVAEAYTLEGHSEANAPDRELVLQETGEAVRKAIAKLPEDLRLPMIFSQYEDRSQAEIAEILGCTVKAVETRIYRAKQLLRKDLEIFLKDVSGIGG